MQDTFETKFKAGNQGEEIARVYLESLGHVVILGNQARDGVLRPESDLLVNGKPVEVKLDILSAKTGNIVIEHQSLKTHTAPFYIYVLPTFYKTTKAKLEHLVASHPDKVKIGDDQRDGTLIKIDSEWFREHFVRL